MPQHGACEVGRQKYTVYLADAQAPYAQYGVENIKIYIHNNKSRWIKSHFFLLCCKVLFLHFQRVSSLVFSFSFTEFTPAKAKPTYFLNRIVV